MQLIKLLFSNDFILFYLDIYLPLSQQSNRATIHKQPITLTHFQRFQDIIVLVHYSPCLLCKLLNFGKSLKPAKLIIAKGEQDLILFKFFICFFSYIEI